jgi:flavin reductase (DIM6/NTAB) family NADH-FMN oxidoreductase RutF
MIMGKKTFGPQPMVWPHPTVLVGALTDGKPDFAAVAWTGIAASNPASVTIALQPHRWSLKGIYQNRTFSINIPAESQVKEADYCGLVSGKDTDKVKDCKFNAFFGDLKTAPLIGQCPINLECEVSHILNLGSHHLVVGKIIQTYYSEEYLTDDKPDWDKVKPFAFGPGKYYRMGDVLADAFKVGWEINPSAKSKKQ